MTKETSSEIDNENNPQGQSIGVQASEREVVYAYIASQLLRENTFKTLRDTDEVLCYSDGIYHFNGETYIAELVESAMGKRGRDGLVTGRFVDEIVGHIRRRTYIDRQELNSRPNLLNLENGILNLDNFKLYPHDKRFLSTIRIPIQFDPDAKCPLINKFFNEIVKPEHVPILYEIPAWCLDTNSPIQVFILLLGEGANGKSTYLELLRRFLGKQNCCAIPVQALSRRFNLATMYGKLANIYADLGPGALWDTSTVKLLTGGDTVQAEEKFKRPFTFRPTAKLIFSANTPPKIDEDTLAIWRRILALQFPNQFMGEKEDKSLLSKLTGSEELSGLLNMVLVSLKTLRDKGEFSYAPSLDTVRDHYLVFSDPVQVFLEEVCYIHPEKQISKEDLYQEFKKFCRQNKVPGYTKTKLGRELSKRKQFRTQGVDWRGLTLRELVSEEEIEKEREGKGVFVNFSS